jgi:hypothetical protein
VGLSIRAVEHPDLVALSLAGELDYHTVREFRRQPAERCDPLRSSSWSTSRRSR